MSELNLYQKILKITNEIGKIEKTGRNSQQGYNFIEQSKIVSELRPQLEKYGVVIVPETISRNVDRYEVTRSSGKIGADVHAKVTSRYTVINADKPDERFVSEWDAGEAIDSGDKATNKAVTASNKSFLMKLFNISDEDPDTHSPVAAPAAAKVPAVKPQDKELAEAKVALNEAFKTAGIDNAIKMKVALNKVLEKSTIDTVNDANEVLQALEDGIL